jgi:hypothetical protein
MQTGTTGIHDHTPQENLMQNLTSATAPNRYSLRYYRMTARAVGVVFLAGMVLYIVGNVALVEPILATPDHLATMSVNSLPLAIGAILMLMPAAGDAAHGILMLPVLKQHNERVAFGYFGARIIDAVFLAIGVALLLLQIPLGREYLNADASNASFLQTLSTLSIDAHLHSYQIAMIAVGLAGLMLCYMFYTARLIPRLLAVWGLIGYAILLSGSVLEVLGFHPGLIHTIPGGLFELFIGVWLIAKGFSSSSPILAQPTTSSTTPTVTSPPLASVTS